MRDDDLAQQVDAWLASGVVKRAQLLVRRAELVRELDTCMGLIKRIDTALLDTIAAETSSPEPSAGEKP